MDAKIPIDEVCGDKEGFSKQFKLPMDINYPINQNCSHILIYLWLSFHIGWIRLSFFFILLHVKLNIRTVLRNMINIIKGHFIYFRNIAKDVLFEPLDPHLNLSVYTNLRQAFSWSCYTFLWHRFALSKLFRLLELSST